MTVQLRAEEGLSNDLEKETQAMETGDILEVESAVRQSHGSLERDENNNSTAFLSLLSSNYFPACSPFEIFLPPAPGK